MALPQATFDEKTFLLVSRPAPLVQPGDVIQMDRQQCEGRLAACEIRAEQFRGKPKEKYYRDQAKALKSLLGSKKG